MAENDRKGAGMSGDDSVMERLKQFWTDAARHPRPGGCPNRPDEDGDWPCDPQVAYGGHWAECSVCGCGAGEQATYWRFMYEHERDRLVEVERERDEWKAKTSPYVVTAGYWTERAREAEELLAQARVREEELRELLLCAVEEAEGRTRKPARDWHGDAIDALASSLPAPEGEGT